MHSNRETGVNHGLQQRQFSNFLSIRGLSSLPPSRRVGGMQQAFCECCHDPGVNTERRPEQHTSQVVKSCPLQGGTNKSWGSACVCVGRGGGRGRMQGFFLTLSIPHCSKLLHTTLHFLTPLHSGAQGT